MKTQIERMVALRRRALVGLVGRDDPLWGLALSGGGIRSATFCLGLVKALAREGLLLRFDLVSTVSGGGFIGAMLGRLFQNVRNTADCIALQSALARTETLAFGDWLRRHGRYLIPRGTSDLRFAAAVMLRNLLGVHVELGFVALVIGCLLALANLGIWGVMEYFAFSGDSPERLLMVSRLAWATATAWLFLPLAAVFFAIAGCAYWATQIGGTTGFVRQAGFWLGWALALYLLLGSGDLAGLFGAWFVALVATLAWMLAYPYLWGIWLWGATDPARVRQRLSNEGGRLLHVAVILAALGLFDRLAWWLAFEARSTLPPAALLIALAVVLRGLLPYLGNSSGGPGTWARRALVLANAFGLLLAFMLAAWWASLVYRLSLGELFLRFSLQWGVALGNLLLVMVPLLIYAVATGSQVEFLNLSSLHPFYRARLVRSYLGAGNHARFNSAGPLGPAGSAAEARAANSGIDDVHADDDVQLEAYAPYRHGGPVHLINVCVNQTLGSPEGGHRDFNVDRRGQLLTIAAHRWCRLGSDGWGRLDRAAAMTLGTWTAISAAAFSPGLGSMTRGGLATLAMFSGVRLGYWWSMSKRPAKGLRQRCGRLFDKSFRVLNETLGRFRIERDRPLFLTDGGHFENTGAYALLRERARLIVLADCGADPGYAFPDLENLVRKARIDLQAVIDFVRPRPTAPLLIRESFGALGELASEHSQSCFALAKLSYLDTGESGWLLLIKPNMFQGLPVDLENFKVSHPEFPQQATTDQFFDESQWESYRRLGEEIGSRLTPALLRLLMLEGDASFVRDDCRAASTTLGQTDTAAAGSRLAARVSQRLTLTTVGHSVGFGAALAAVGVPVWQGVEAYRTSLQVEDQADRAALKEISEKWGKLQIFAAPTAASAPGGAASAVPAQNALSDLAAALVRTQDILCQRDEGDWFRRSKLAREALTGAIRDCKSITEDMRSPACQTLVRDETTNCLIGDVSARLPQCPPTYWGRDWAAVSARAQARLRAAPGSIATAPTDQTLRPLRDGSNAPLCDTPADWTAEWRVVVTRVRTTVASEWTNSFWQWLQAKTEFALRPGANSKTTTRPDAPVSAPVPASQASKSAEPASTESGNSAPAPVTSMRSTAGVCADFTVYVQIYGPEARSTVSTWATRWSSSPEIAAKVPGVEDVFATADRAARLRPVPYARTTVLYRDDDQGAEACARQLYEAAVPGPDSDPAANENWEVRPFPASIQSPRRVIEVWYVWPRWVLVAQPTGSELQAQALVLRSRLRDRGYSVPPPHSTRKLQNQTAEPTAAARAAIQRLCIDIAQVRRELTGLNPVSVDFELVDRVGMAKGDSGESPLVVSLHDPADKSAPASLCEGQSR